MLKDKIGSPKVLMISAIILTALCVCLYALEEKEKAGRVQVVKELGKAVAAKRAAEAKLVDLQKEIAVRDEQIKTALDKLEIETVARKDAETKLQAAQSAVPQAAAPATPAPNVELEKIVVKPEATPAA